MERMLTKKATAAGYTMEVTVMKIGEDFQICLAGGEKPHIGCVVPVSYTHLTLPTILLV